MLLKGKNTDEKNNRANLVNLFSLIAIIILLNIIAQYIYTDFDFTDDKSFTLTEPTRKLIKEQDDVIFVKVLLEGDFPAGFKRLQRSVYGMLRRFQSMNPRIDFVFEDPTKGSVETANANIEKLRKEGIKPVNLFIGQGSSRTTRQIFPYAVINHGRRVYVVNLLEPNTLGLSEEESLNNSIALLEYKFANAIQKLKVDRRGNIVFVADKGGPDDMYLEALFRKLNQFYYVSKIKLDSTYRIVPEIDLVIIPKPAKEFSKRNQFVLDQYLMKGGNIIWLIDKLEVDLDSLNKHPMFTPRPYDLGLDDLFFKYGIRINNDLIQDLQSTRIPQVVGFQGDMPQIQKFPWPYDLLVNSISEHPISRGLSDIYMPFVSSIDTIRTSRDIRKTVLLSSSKRSRFQMYPMRLTYQILQYPLEVELFNKENIPLAVLVEGKFESFFQHRLTSDTEDMLQSIGETFISESQEEGKMIFVSDGDFILNHFDSRTNQFTPIGYNRWEEYRFSGNEDFIINSIEYMMDDAGILESRSKRVKLRLLDRAKLEKNRFLIQVLNIGLPLVIVAIFGIVYSYLRRRKYKVRKQEKKG